MVNLSEWKCEQPMLSQLFPLICSVLIDLLFKLCTYADLWILGLMQVPEFKRAKICSILTVISDLYHTITEHEPKKDIVCIHTDQQ